MSTMDQEMTVEEAAARSIAAQIKLQIGIGGLMSLGARNFVTIPNGLRFESTILPFNQNGSRSSRPSKMFVEITLNANDYYDVRVARLARYEVIDHYRAADIDASQLPMLMLALDYDGDEVLNPRYA